MSRFQKNMLLRIPAEQISQNKMQTHLFNQKPIENEILSEEIEEESEDKIVHVLDEESIVIGMPDYADGGGLYIEYHYFGEHKFWLIDQMKTNVPDYLHGFIDIVNEKISIINS